MASNDTLCTFTALDNEPLASNFATLDTRNNHPVLDFDDTTQESAVFSGVLPRHYAAGGITVTVIWMATSATSGSGTWQVSFERHADDADDLDADSFAAAQSASEATASASGEPKYTDVVFTNAQIDGLAAGESFRLKVSRDPADGITGDLELLAVEVRES